jgi:hypothetical protein
MKTINLTSLIKTESDNNGNTFWNNLCRFQKDDGYINGF